MSRPAVLFLSCAIAAAAGCSPASVAPSRHGADVLLPIDATTIAGRIPRDATLESVLRQNKVQQDMAASMAGAMRGVFNPRSIRADRSYRLVRTLDGLFREFQYQIDADRFLRVVFRDRRADTGQPEFDVAVVPYPKEIHPVVVSAQITRERPSLVSAFDAVGESLQLPLEVAGIFGGVVDFNSELRRGDRLTVLFDRVTREGEPAGYGEVRGAVLENDGRHFTAIRFAGADGKSAWYDEAGRSLKREFLKSPLPFEPRITSQFSTHRLHPVYGGYRAHLGVDYAAPSGTPVIAVAAGTVIAADWRGDAGRMVTIRHAGGYETSYLHLSSFAEGIHPGVHVVQGQALGRVGSTGAATGPHLDYRIRKNGVPVNPVLEHSRMPPGLPLAPSALPAFFEERDRILQQMKGTGGP